MTKRVYHPTLDSFEDIPDGDAEAWAAAGWRKTAPKHFTTDDAPEIGSHPGYAQIPVELEAPTPTKTSRASSTPTTGGSSASATTA